MSKIVIALLQTVISAEPCPCWQALQPLLPWAETRKISLQATQIPAVYKECLITLEQLINQNKPSHIILLMQNRQLSQINLEKVALNIINSSEADSKGTQPVDALTAQTGPAAYFSNIPLDKILAAQRQHQLPVQLSYHADTALANHAFYGLMHYIKHQNISLYGGLIQLPLLPQQACQYKTAASISEILLRDALQQVLLICQDDSNSLLKQYR